MGGAAALICAISFALFMLAVAAVAFKLARTLSTTNRILEDFRRETLPLLGKFQTTMDHVNREMGYVDGVLETVEKLAERINSMTKVAQELVASPLVRLLTFGVGIRRALSGSGSGHDGEDSDERGK